MSIENKISVILPIKSGKAIDFKEFFDKCIQSIRNQGDFLNELIIVHGSEDYLTNFLNEYDFSGLTVVNEVWNKEPNFAKQVNRGVEQDTILESIEDLKEQIEKTREMVSLEQDDFAQQFAR
jgi:glycosyltransferase involved in cell wall biosynthesis